MTKHVNGKHLNGNPYGIHRRLRRLLEYHQGIVDALSTTIAVLEEESEGRKRGHSADLLASAIQLDAERVARRRGRPRKARGGSYDRTTGKVKPGYSSKSSIAARRERSMKFLAHFDRTEPRPMPPGATAQNSGLGPLVNSGYLRKKGEGYIRTAKEYSLA